MPHKHFYKITSAILTLALASLACQSLQPSGATAAPQDVTQPPVTHPTEQPTIPAPNISANQPYEITGTFTYTNEIITEYYVEDAVALVDMYGFVKRDKDWIIPVSSQTLGFLQIDPAKKTGAFSVQLPEVPLGQFVDVDNNGKPDTGVQVFAVSYWPNLSGGPYSEGDDKSTGWPNYLASVRTDSEKQDEVTGGKLVVWSPDDKQQFPTAFGADGKLFTADDPVGPMPAGYSIVDLDKKPFELTRPAKPNMTLYEPTDAAIKDYSKDSYSAAFDKLVAFLRTEYAFNGIQGKQPDWDKLVASLRPRVLQAEQNQDANAYYAALRDFIYAFKDGHTGMNAGDLFTQDFQTNYVGSLGFNARVLDDGRVLVKYVLPGGPAEKAGMKAGAVITKLDGKAVRDVIDAQPLFFNLQSSPIGTLYSKTILLTRTKPGAQVSVSFTNPGGQEQSVTLTAFREVDNLLTELGYNQSQGLVPVELQTLKVGDKTIGYLKINTNSDDLNLLVRLFERGLKKFQEQKVAGIIIDLRNNSGGAPLGLAGFLTDQEIIMGQMQYYSSAAGKFEPEGEPEKVTPNQNQYHFDKMAVLVGLNCASACELEAYGFSQVPGMMVVGQYPTGGIEAEVSRGQIKMPENISMQFPTGREVLPDGSLFLEGTGVQPTIHVPVNETTVLSPNDVVLQAAEDAILGK
ncbi:MAG: S41 family peptidase [Anaerolineales bacterium]